MKENKLNEFEETYKNNLLTLNVFFISFTFSFLPLFLFLFSFPQISQELNIN